MPSLSLSVLLFVSPSQSLSLLLFICRDHLPPCTLSSLDASRMNGYWLGNQWFPFGCRLSNLSPSQLSQCLDGKNILLAGEGVTP